MPEDTREDLLRQLREKYKDRKVLIASPSTGFMHWRFYDSFSNLIEETAPVVKMSRAWVIGSRISEARNEVVEQARIVGATDILWWDDDQISPTNGLLRLLSNDKDIACATTCPREGNNHDPIGIALEQANENQLARMERVGMPFMLTKTSIFDKLQKPYFAEPPVWMYKKINNITDDSPEDGVIGEDVYFCFNARNAGFDIWCDGNLSLEIGHIGMHVNYIENGIVSIEPKNLDIKLG